MNRILILTVFIFLATADIYAQADAYPPHAQSTVPATSRFEIVQSHLAAKWTFLLDKHLGNVYQLVKTKKDGMAWERIPVIDLPKSPADGKVRYQLFSSGIAARHTFLINIETSKTWMLVTEKDDKRGEYLVWEPFEDN